MAFVDWMIANWQAVLAILAALLSVAIAIAHLAHADSVATKIQGIEDMINKISKPS